MRSLKISSQRNTNIFCTMTKIVVTVRISASKAANNGMLGVWKVLLCMCTRERMWRGGHFDTPDEVVHGNLDLVLHVLHTTPQRMQMERAIPVVTREIRER